MAPAPTLNLLSTVGVLVCFPLVMQARAWCRSPDKQYIWRVGGKRSKKNGVSPTVESLPKQVELCAQMVSTGGEEVNGAQRTAPREHGYWATAARVELMLLQQQQQPRKVSLPFHSSTSHSSLPSLLVYSDQHTLNAPTTSTTTIPHCPYHYRSEADM